MPAQQNPFFDFSVNPYRFAPRTLARAEDVNARFDEVSGGFTGVKTRLDTLDTGVANLVTSKAPLANPAFTGGASVDGKPLATQEFAQGLAMQTALPASAGQRGKVPSPDASGAVAWRDILGAPVPISASGLLAERTVYHADCSAGPLALLMPASTEHGSWVIVRDVKFKAGTNKITLTGNGSVMPGGDPTYEMDLNGDCVTFVLDTTNGWVRA